MTQRKNNLPPYVYKVSQTTYRIIRQVGNIRVNGPACLTPEEAASHLDDVEKKLQFKIHGENYDQQSILNRTPWQGLLGVNTITARFNIPESQRDTKNQLCIGNSI